MIFLGFPNEKARQAEMVRRLAQDASYQALRAEADRLRQEVRAVDAEMEQVSRRHRSDCQVAYLAASLLGVGLRAEAVLAAYGSEPEAPEEPQAQAAPEPPKTQAEPKPEAQAQG